MSVTFVASMMFLHRFARQNIKQKKWNKSLFKDMHTYTKCELQSRNFCKKKNIYIYKVNVRNVPLQNIPFFCFKNAKVNLSVTEMRPSSVFANTTKLFFPSVFPNKINKHFVISSYIVIFVHIPSHLQLLPIIIPTHQNTSLGQPKLQLQVIPHVDNIVVK